MERMRTTVVVDRDGHVFEVSRDRHGVAEVRLLR